jgi:DNA-binding transcriptional LysR family regulator
MTSEITLEQWRALTAVVEHRGYARAAEALDKSQSTISYRIERLEELLGTQVLKIQGRRAVPTKVGEMALRRARTLLAEAGDIERAARTLASGVEAEVHIAVDTIFPNQIVLPAFQQFAAAFPDTRIEMYETVITGFIENLRSGAMQLAITPFVPQGWLGDHLLDLEFVCVTHPAHPLHRLNRPVTESDLRRHRQLVVRETDPRRTSGAGWLGSEQRLTVGTLATSIQALCQGLGFSWMPRLKIARELSSDLLKVLPMERGSRRMASVYLVFADREDAGPATTGLAKHIRKQVAETCAAAQGDAYTPY